MELNNQNLANNPGEQGQQNAGTDNSNNNEEKSTFTREEVEKLIQQESDKRVSQALQTQERKNQARLREAEKLANMSAEEKYRYELDQREAAIIEKERALLLAENKAEASKILNDKGLPSAFLDFVVAETAEEMSSKINIIDRAFKTAIKAEVEKRLGNSTPKTSDPGPMTKEQFTRLPLSQQQELYNNDREKYMALVNQK